MVEAAEHAKHLEKEEADRQSRFLVRREGEREVGREGGRGRGRGGGREGGRVGEGEGG